MANLNNIQTRYEVLNRVRPVDGEYLRQLQAALKISLPHDFIQITYFLMVSAYHRLATGDERSR
jgi:hypothetical protein